MSEGAATRKGVPAIEPIKSTPRARPKPPKVPPKRKGYEKRLESLRKAREAKVAKRNAKPDPRVQTPFRADEPVVPDPHDKVVQFPKPDPQPVSAKVEQERKTTARENVQLWLDREATRAGMKTERTVQKNSIQDLKGSLSRIEGLLMQQQKLQPRLQAVDSGASQASEIAKSAESRRGFARLVNTPSYVF